MKYLTLKNSLYGAVLAFFLAIIGAWANPALAQSNGTLKVVVSNAEGPAEFAQVILKQEGGVVGGGETDINGVKLFSNLSPGAYSVEVLYIDQKKEYTNVVVRSNSTEILNATLGESSLVELGPVVIQERIVKQDATANEKSIDNNAIKQTAARGLNNVVATVGSVYQKDNGGGLNIGGARSDQTQTYIDGMRVIGIGNSSTVPQASMGNVSVITRGVPPWYGDLTSGVIEITTRNPSPEHHFGAEGVTSQFLDGYGYNLAAVNATGPLLRTKLDSAQKAMGMQRMTKIGYFIAGEAEYNKDRSPSYFGAPVLNDGLLQDLQTNPLQPDPNGQGFVNRANFLGKDDIYYAKAKPNNSDLSISLNGRLDFKLNKSMDLKAGGTARWYDSNLWSMRSSLLAPEAHENRKSQDYRGFLRFSQYFTPDSADNSIMKEFYYTLQGDYTRSQYTRSDSRLGDDVFAYGHVGKFTSARAETYELIQPSDARHNPEFSSNSYWQTAGFVDTAYYFDPSTSRNPLLSNYNTYIYQQMANRPRQFSLFPDVPFTFRNGVRNQLDLLQLGGLLNGYNTTGGNASLNVYSLWDGQGTNWGAFVKNQTDMFRVTGQATMILGPKSSAKKKKNADGEEEYKREGAGTHTIKFGFEFDQRFERFYSLGAPSLWLLMRSLSNAHLANLDQNSATPKRDENGFFLGRVNLNPLYDGASQSNFDKEFRKKLGQDTSSLDFLNPDQYDPSFFSLNMFTANELLNNGNSIVTYYGYDHRGNTVGQAAPENFFTDPVLRPQNAYAPTYVAGYVQDKFELGNVFFSLGLRVDRFDANQKVLKDKFVLGSTYQAGDKATTDLLEGNKLPSGIGSNFVPYVNSRTNPDQVLGYRDGAFWYDKDGSPVDPTLLQVNGRVIPFMKTRNDSLTIDAFEDYRPQVNFMPRISFSFPINDLANFFAHYDVLTQRPTVANVGLMSDYYFLQQNATNSINNPNLKPTKTIDYEVGFQQSLNERGDLAIVISAYYRDMSNMIQTVRNNNAFPITYDSFENVDFGTVKGFTFEFLTRRLGLFRFRTAYTLQFAQGTGSSFSSSRNALNGIQGFGLIRTLLPLSFDQRHTISGNLDIRFEDKNLGPEIFGVRPLKNAGASFTFNLGSGTPYTRNAIPNQADVQFGVNEAIQTKGTAFGSRLPFAFRLDLRVDKTFEIGLGGGKKAKGEPAAEGSPVAKAKRKMEINVYAVFLNLFNVQNIFGVYQYSGLPDDSGYLTSPQGRQLIQAQINPTSFVEQYNIRQKNPDNYSLPRRIRLGLMLNF